MSHIRLRAMSGYGHGLMDILSGLKTMVQLAACAYYVNGHRNLIITCTCVNCFRNGYFSGADPGLVRVRVCAAYGRE